MQHAGVSLCMCGNTHWGDLPSRALPEASDESLLQQRAAGLQGMQMCKTIGYTGGPQDPVARTLASEVAMRLGTAEVWTGHAASECQR